MDKITDTVHHQFHLDLSDAHPGETYYLHVNGKSYPVTPHTLESISQLRKDAPQLVGTPDNELTHFVAEAVPLPKDQAIRVHVKHTLDTFNLPDIEGPKGSFHSAIIVPPEAMAKARADAAATKTPPDSPSPSGSIPIPEPHHHINWTSTAVALVFHHADLITHNATYAATILNYMTDQNSSPIIVQKVNTLATKMKSYGPPTPKGVTPTGWAVLDPVVVEKKDPQPGSPNHTKTTTYCQQTPIKEVRTSSEAGDLMTSMMITPKNNMSLQNKKWMQQHGTAVAPVEDSGPGDTPSRTVDLTSIGNGDDWIAAFNVTGEQNGVIANIMSQDSAKTQVKINLENHWLRWLGVYISFKDAEGDLVDISTWSSGLNSTLQSIMSGLENDNYRFIGYIEPVDSILGIPIVAEPGQLENGNNQLGDGITITFPDKAVSATIHSVGLGTGSIPYGDAVVFGGLATGLINIAIPSLMIGLVVAIQSYKPLYKALQEPALIKVLIALGASVFAAVMGGPAAHGKFNFMALTELGQIIFNVAMSQLFAKISPYIISGEVEDEIPFLGWAAAAIMISEDVAELAETIVEVADSPWFIDRTLSLTIDTAVTLNPDPRANGQWPQAAGGSNGNCQATMVYKQQSRASIKSTAVTVLANNPPPTLSFGFLGNTLGGEMKIEVEYFIDHWLAGKATSGWIDNNNTDAASITMYLVEMPKPITSTSIYEHSSILIYDKSSSQYAWNATTTVPGTTIANLSAATGGNQISECAGLTLSQQHGVLSPAFKAAGTGVAPASGSGYDTQLFAMQSVDIPGVGMSDVNFVSAGFTQEAKMVYDPYPPKFEMKKGTWVLKNGKPEPDPNNIDLGSYYIDPLKATVSLGEGGGFHLRKVTITGDNGFDTDPANPPLSHGRFPFAPDHMAMHPSGHVVGINQDSCKIMLCNLDMAGKKDIDIPVAISNAGKALIKIREGLLFRPIAVGCSHDGTILVLDQIFSADIQHSRIQAFDLLGRPVSCFSESDGSTTALLPLPSTQTHSGTTKNITYLDLEVLGSQHMTFMFLLYYVGGGTQTDDYNVAIYGYKSTSITSDMTPIVTATTVPAARLTVDMWHTMYTQNYQMIKDKNGNFAGPTNSNTGPDGRTVTSVSEWVISNP